MEEPELLYLGGVQIVELKDYDLFEYYDMKILKVLRKEYAGEIYLTCVKDDASRMAAIKVFDLSQDADKGIDHFCAEVCDYAHSPPISCAMFTEPCSQHAIELSLENI
ncbi:hypothetical protein ElyMa_004934800 [Elysia marginata]|uniref:Protein kinase domain-containing protein n=1 Tax=Elysia marginata TaxID=1093978 RepID=A0AAV4J1J5_9GAST|nr:hypothetical protein ElyMa_004934800 [Elysia marginata]